MKKRTLISLIALCFISLNTINAQGFLNLQKVRQWFILPER